MIAVLAGAPGAHAAESYQARCAVPVAERFVRLVDDWHASLGERAVGLSPNLREISDLRVRLERLERAWKLQRFAWAAEHAADRIDLSGGVPTGLELDWDENLEGRLRTAEPDYADLREQWRNAEQAERRHPRRNALQRTLRERVLNTAAHAEVARKLMDEVTPLNQRWRDCAVMDKPKAQSLTE